MRKTTAAALGFVAIMAFSVAASAAATQVMKGTPVIDGKKDAIWNQTVAIPEDYVSVYSSGEPADTDARGISYLMYDSNYFYIYGEVTDKAVVKNDNASGPAENPWDQDAFESWIDLGDGVFKASVSPFVDYVFGQDTAIDLASCKYGCSRTAKGWDIEVAIPATGLVKGGTIGYVLQLNDFNGDGVIRCFGHQAAGVVEYTLGDAVK